MGERQGAAGAGGADAAADAKCGSIGAGSDTTPKCIVRAALRAAMRERGFALSRYRPAAPPPLRGSKAPFRSPGAIVIAPTAPSDGTSLSR